MQSSDKELLMLSEYELTEKGEASLFGSRVALQELSVSLFPISVQRYKREEKTPSSVLEFCILRSSTGLLEIAGEASCGKTQLWMSCVEEPVAVFYTEGKFPITRFREIQKRTEVFILSPRTLTEFYFMVCYQLREFVRVNGIKTVVVDSIAAIVRSEVRCKSRSASLFRISEELRAVQREERVRILVVNQATQTEERSIPALGLSWSYCVDSYVWLYREENRRFARYEERTEEIRIEEGGVVSVVL